MIVKDNDTGNCIYSIFKQQNGEWERIEGSEFEVGSFGFALGQTKTKGWFDIIVTLTENGNNIGKTYKWNGKKYTLAETTPSDEGEMTTNADMILGRWASQTVKGFEVEFKDGQRIEFQDGVEGGWMPYSVVESCDNQTDDAMGSALSVKYDCYTLEFTSSDEFIVQQQSPKKGKKEVYKRK